MGLVRTEVERTYSCDACGKEFQWNENSRSKTILHAKGCWDEEITVCSEMCGIEYDNGKRPEKGLKLMTDTVEQIIALCEALPTFSMERMPYTYHHDYIRSKFHMYFKSRGDVAEAFKDADDEHLYLIAFLYLFDAHTGTDLLRFLTTSQFELASKILAKAEYCVTEVVEDLRDGKLGRLAI